METLKKFLIIAILLFSVNIVLAFAEDEFKVIIDAGHGGKDGGTSCLGYKEKDITLEVVLLLQKVILEKEQTLKSLLTRSEDKFVSLEDRIVFANQSQGNLFLSLHVNSSQSKKDNGFEIYYNVLSSDEADKENNKENTPLFILWDLAQNEFLKEGAEFADKLQDSIETMFNKGEDKKFSMRNRGIKQSSFILLRGIRMPAVLVEMGFISNVSDEENFKQKEFKEKYVEAIFNAILSYKQKKIQ
ncbi:MAG: N-acetylmuramoyl-L-alanine amidase [Candidatus Firestonebacteria bacterium]